VWTVIEFNPGCVKLYCAAYYLLIMHQNSAVSHEVLPPLYPITIHRFTIMSVSSSSIKETSCPHCSKRFKGRRVLCSLTQHMKQSARCHQLERIKNGNFTVPANVVVPARFVSAGKAMELVAIHQFESQRSTTQQDTTPFDHGTNVLYP
jgi:hypothetical protein